MLRTLLERLGVYMPNYDLRERSYQFSLELIKLLCGFSSGGNMYPIFNQLVRSGTSIGANIEEADSSPTRKDLKYKMVIAKKEAAETVYWLRLVIDAGLIKNENNIIKTKELLVECGQIVKILGSITRKI